MVVCGWCVDNLKFFKNRYGMRHENQSRYAVPMMFDAVLFDCDGVLVDSEPITNGVLHEVLVESGWSLTSYECMQLFIGKTVRSQQKLIEQHTGRPLTDAWMESFYQRRDVALQARLQPMHGALAAVACIHAQTGGRIACASGADRAKVLMQLSHVGLLAYFDTHIFSGHDMPLSKPAPDVYWAAAQSLNVAPERCWVVEDTPTGVLAGVCAGARVVGLCPSGDAGLPHIGADDLLDAGACAVIRSMRDLPRFLFGAMGSAHPSFS